MFAWGLQLLSVLVIESVIQFGTVSGGLRCCKH